MSAENEAAKAADPAASADRSAANAANPLPNTKHEAVLQAYIADPERVGWRAYSKVYPESSDGAAKTAFSRLLKKADFGSRLAHLNGKITEKVVDEAAVTIERTVAELAKIGFASAKHYLGITDDGEPYVDLSNLADDQYAALAEVTVDDFVDARAGSDELPEPQAQGGELRRRRGREVRRVRFKLHNKQAALVSILEHLGGFPARKLADPDGRPLGSGAAEKLGDKLSDLEVARRVAFVLSRGAKAKK
jgi:phage terminase small subunit